VAGQTKRLTSRNPVKGSVRLHRPKVKREDGKREDHGMNRGWIEPSGLGVTNSSSLHRETKGHRGGKWKGGGGGGGGSRT